MDVHENHLNCRGMVRKYLETTCRAKEDNDTATVKRWKYVFRKEEAAGFMKKLRRKKSTGR